MSTTDGKVLGMIGVTADGRLDTIYDWKHRASLPSAYSDNADYTRRKKEPRPEEQDCVVRTPISSYTYELTTDDMSRVADLVADDTGMHRNQVLEALSRCRPGGEVRFEE